MLYATNIFAGDGHTTQYEINFVGKYLDKSHVKAYVYDDSTKLSEPVPILPNQWLNDTTITGFPVTPVGKFLIIYRDTPKPTMVDFVNGSRVTETSLDIAARQGLFVAIEALDAANLPFSITSYVNTFNGRAGDIVLAGSDVVGALGYTPRDAADACVESFNGETGDVVLSGQKIKDLLGYTPRDSADTLVESFNNRVGDVSLSAVDIIDALGYIPSGEGVVFVHSVNGRQGDVVIGGDDIVAALGYTPKDSATPAVDTFNGRTGDVALASPDVVGALGYLPAGMWDTPPNQNLDLLINGGMYHVDANPVNGPPGLAGQYSQLLVVRGAGGSMWQLLVSMGSANMWYRTGIPVSPPTWDPWRQIIDSNVALVNSFNGRTGAVSLTGGDVTNALGYTPISKAIGDTYYPAIGHYPATGVNLNSIVNGGMYRIGGDPVNGPPGNAAQYSQLLVVRGAVDTIWQMVVNYSNNQLWYRAGNPPEAGGSGVWNPWQFVVTSANQTMQLANPWYIKIPGGLILQGGKIGPFGGSGTFGPYSFGTTFPSACISLVVSGERSNQVEVTDGTITTSNFKFTVSAGNNLYVHWFAAGY